MLKLCQMEALKNTNFEDYQIEIAKPWKTQETDIALLKTLIAQEGDQISEHRRKMSVSFQVQPQDQGVELQLPTWVLMAHKAFETLYGIDYGSVIFEKALAKIWDSFVPQQPLRLS